MNYLNKLVNTTIKIRAKIDLFEALSIILPWYLLISFVVLVVIGVEMNYSFGILDPLIKTFIEVVIIVGPLSIVGVILMLKKIEKDNPDRIRWK